MRRREFIALIGGVAASRPLASHAQQAERMRRVGVLLPATADDREFQARISAFRQEIEKLGWTEGRNIRIDYHWAAAGADRLRAAASMVASAPDAILADSTVILAALKSVTQTVPIVFVQVPDPVQGGFVASLARPGGNITGFTNFEYTLGEKWLELLKEVVPGVARAGVLQNPADRASTEYTRAIAAVAPSTGVQVTAASPKNAIEIEPAIAPFARESNGGMIVLPGVFTFINHKAIVTLAAQLRSCRLFIPTATLSLRAVSFPTESRRSIFIGVPRRMLIASSRARSRPTCRCRRQTDSNWWSTSRPPRLSALLYRRCSWPVPTT